MPKHEQTLHETMAQALFAEQVELIDVPNDGDRIALLRTREMPGYAFVLWVDHERSTRSQMRFALPDDQVSAYYSVVCACCNSEIYGLTCPSDNEVMYNTWQKQQADRFKASLMNTCEAHRIHTLFMRKANGWDRHYGSVPSVKIVEASEHRNRLLDKYGRETIRAALRFIHPESMGLTGDRSF